MKKFSIPIFSLTIMFSGIAQTYTPKDEKQAVTFAIKNFGLTVNGSFTGIKGSISFNPSNLPGASFNVSVDAATVNTDNNSRDGHLRKEDYFNVDIFKTISLVSTKITEGTTKGAYIFNGLLSIKGTNKTISFPFTATPVADGYSFGGSFKINRLDFKVGGSSLILSDYVTVALKISAKKN